MPIFMIERNFAEQIEITQDSQIQIAKINEDVGVQWLFSFLSADKKRLTACMKPRVLKIFERLPGEQMFQQTRLSRWVNYARRCSDSNKRWKGRS